MSPSNCRSWGLAANGFGRGFFQQLRVGPGRLPIPAAGSWLSGRLLCRFQRRRQGSVGVDQTRDEGRGATAPRGDGFDGLAVLGSQLAVQTGRGGRPGRRARPDRGSPMPTRSISLSNDTVGCRSRE